MFTSFPVWEGAHDACKSAVFADYEILSALLWRSYLIAAFLDQYTSFSIHLQERHVKLNSSSIRCNNLSMQSPSQSSQESYFSLSRTLKTVFLVGTDTPLYISDSLTKLRLHNPITPLLQEVKLTWGS